MNEKMKGSTQEEQKVTWGQGQQSMISFAILGFPLAYSTSCLSHNLVTAHFSGEIADNKRLQPEDVLCLIYCPNLPFL